MTDQALRELERRWKETGAATDRDAYVEGWRRTLPNDVCLVYRSHYEGPLSKRVTWLPGRSVLEWFQLAFTATSGREEGEIYDWVAEAAGGSVYGLPSVFRAAAEQSLPVPESWKQLGALLEEHLYLESDGPVIDASAGTLRCQTDDDEVALAYFLFTREYAAARPTRTAYLLQEDWRLPTSTAPGEPSGREVEIDTVGPAGEGEGRTYAVFLTFYDGDSLDAGCVVIPGVRLGGLPDYLRQAPAVGSGWPLELKALRAHLGEDESDLRPALERCEGLSLEGIWNRCSGDYATARAEIADDPLPVNGGDRSQALLQIGDHFAQVCAHVTSWAGYQQWFLFDDVWAAAQPALANSLLRYAKGWDPFA